MNVVVKLELNGMLEKLENFCLLGKDKLVVWSSSLEASK